jgi:hypothetical protein
VDMSRGFLVVLMKGVVFGVVLISTAQKTG